jgi:small nuclear ribonucleoprotein
VYIISNNEYNQNLSEIDKLLQQTIGKDVLIRLKNNITVKGKLKSFDHHLNLFLNEGKIESKEGTEQLQDMLLRGSDVLVVSI